MSFIDGEPRDHEAVHIALARHAVLACQDLFKMVRHAMLACQEACFIVLLRIDGQTHTKLFH